MPPGAKTARLLFWLCGLYGILLLPAIALSPARFLGNVTISQPEYFYGFLAVGFAWQIAFFIIGANPIRYRPMMIPAIAEKLSFVACLVALIITGKTPFTMIYPAIIDCLMGITFIYVWLNTATPKAKPPIAPPQKPPTPAPTRSSP